MTSPNQTCLKPRGHDEKTLFRSNDAMWFETSGRKSPRSEDTKDPTIQP